jgi:hypothetical protein
VKVFIIVGIMGGTCRGVSAHLNQEKARAQRTALLTAYDLTDDDKPDNRHNPECRWRDDHDNELHLHEVELQE